MSPGGKKNASLAISKKTLQEIQAKPVKNNVHDTTYSRVRMSSEALAHKSAKESIMHWQPESIFD
jgi:hypothetical protein